MLTCGAAPQKQDSVFAVAGVSPCEEKCPFPRVGVSVAAALNSERASASRPARNRMIVRSATSCATATLTPPSSGMRSASTSMIAVCSCACFRLPDAITCAVERSVACHAGAKPNSGPTIEAEQRPNDKRRGNAERRTPPRACRRRASGHRSGAPAESPMARHSESPRRPQLPACPMVESTGFQSGAEE